MQRHVLSFFYQRLLNPYIVNNIGCNDDEAISLHFQPRSHRERKYGEQVPMLITEYGPFTGLIESLNNLMAAKCPIKLLRENNWTLVHFLLKSTFGLTHTS